MNDFMATKTTPVTHIVTFMAVSIEFQFDANRGLIPGREKLIRN